MTDEIKHECVYCGKPTTSDVWKPGEVCIFGMFYACSEACAIAWLEAEGTEYTADDLDIEQVTDDAL